MDTQGVRNQKIINAVLEKERSLCPGAVALIGVYGSFQTGDVHPLSDLDLLILINDDRGWALQTALFPVHATRRPTPFVLPFRSSRRSPAPSLYPRSS